MLAFMQALNGLRLVLGTVLDVSEDTTPTTSTTTTRRSASTTCTTSSAGCWSGRFGRCREHDAADRARARVRADRRTDAVAHDLGHVGQRLHLVRQRIARARASPATTIRRRRRPAPRRERPARPPSAPPAAASPTSPERSGCRGRRSTAPAGASRRRAPRWRTARAARRPRADDERVPMRGAEALGDRRRLVQRRARDSTAAAAAHTQQPDARTRPCPSRPAAPARASRAPRGATALSVPLQRAGDVDRQDLGAARGGEVVVGERELARARVAGRHVRAAAGGRGARRTRRRPRSTPSRYSYVVDAHRDRARPRCRTARRARAAAANWSPCRCRWSRDHLAPMSVSVMCGDPRRCVTFPTSERSGVRRSSGRVIGTLTVPRTVPDTRAAL